MEYRIEHDSMGEVKVPADKYWAAQTERSHENFPIGVGLETMPREITHAFGILKQAAARANHALKPEKMTAENDDFLERMQRQIEERLAAEGIPVFEVRPGIIDTDMTKVVHKKYQKLIDEGLLPIRRFGEPQDVAKMVLACCSGLLDYSAGQVLDADGGFSLRRL